MDGRMGGSGEVRKAIEISLLIMQRVARHIWLGWLIASGVIALFFHTMRCFYVLPRMAMILPSVFHSK